MFYEIWKTWSLALDEETDQLYELNKQQEDEIKKLKTRLQAKENTSFDFIYSERSRSQKIPNSSLFTDEKNSTWKNWYEKIQNKLEINVNLFSNERVKLSYAHFRLFNDAAECYKRIKTEKGWSFNQFAKYASEYSAYWLELVSVSSSDLTQSLFSFLNISLFNIIFLSTSYSTYVTNTFSLSLAQSLNIT